MIGQDDITRRMLDKIRVLEQKNEGRKALLKEEESKQDKGADGIAITDDPKFGQNVLTNQIQQFRTAVESGAEFNKPNDKKVSEAPLIYQPSTGNLIFSGIIPCLNNLKWQFVLKTNTGNGCFIWGDGVILNRENMQILTKLHGYYLNWRESWISESADLEKMAEKIING